MLRRPPSALSSLLALFAALGLTSSCTLRFALAADAGSDASSAPDAGPHASVQSEPLACRATGTGSTVVRLTPSVATGPLVDVAMLELGAMHVPHVLFVRGAGLRSSPELAMLRGAPPACDVLEPLAASPFSSLVADPLSRVVASELRGAPALLAVHDDDEPQAVVMRDGAEGFVRELDAFAVLLRHGAARGLALGDVDGDGVEDLVSISEGGVQLALMGRGGRVLQLDVRDQERVWLVDLDGDGRLDLLAAPDPALAESVTLRRPEVRAVALLGDGMGGFAPAEGSDGTLAELSWIGPVTVLDIDLDGDADVVQWASDADDVVPELLRNASVPGRLVLAREPIDAVGTPSRLGLGIGVPGAEAVADLDVDGAPDVIGVGNLLWTMVRGGSTPRLFVVSSLSGIQGTVRPHRIAVGDADADGDLDVAFPARVSGGTAGAMVLGDAGAAATVALRIEGAPAAGTELCLASEGELPERGCAGALLGHSLGIASTAQGDLAQTRLFTVRDGARVDVRVIVRRPEGALELDVPGLAVGARHVITLGD